MIRFTADVLNGVPSIVMGIAIYTLIVVPQKHFSALAGGVALGIMMIPTITRSTEEMLRLVPNSIREAALGLGIPQWRSTLSITLRTAMSGVITGVMLAFARVSGETAPLLFTAFGNQFWSSKLDQPIAALLKDLKQRKLLDSTLVIWLSEFGRTPLGENRGGSSRWTDSAAAAARPALPETCSFA